jgi:hypothetical protein
MAGKFCHMGGYIYSPMRILQFELNWYLDYNNLSTSDLYTKSTKKAGKYYEVERVIGQ